MIVLALIIGAAVGLWLGIVAVRGQRANRRAGIPQPARRHRRDAASGAVRGYYAGRAVANHRVPQYLVSSACWRAWRRMR